APLVARHVYGVPAPDPRVRVVATDDDGLTDTVTVPMTVGWHYDCGFLKRGYDAPADPDSVLVFRPEPTCLGDLGHTLADGSVDVADVYRFSEHTGIAPSVRLTMAHDPGLDASLYVDWYVFGVGAVRFLGSGDPPTVNIPAAFEGDYFVHLVRDGGKGAYTLTFDEAVPP
ncbi:MAG TPA: hypothetical protein VI997_03000, partial [Candidatus Thermoplasmatota archaeon]|nr:hypothetical protein [Candidatus Thermoplasmatota archaeon]